MSQTRSNFERSSGKYDSQKLGQIQKPGRSQKPSVNPSLAAETLESDMSGLSENVTIEADGEFDETGENFDSLVDDEELNAAFEVEHNSMFQVIDEVGEETEETESSMPPPGNDSPKKRFVIPKLKKPETPDLFDGNSSCEEGKREWRKNERDMRARYRDAGKAERGHGDRSRDWDKGRRESKEDRQDQGKLHSDRDQSENGHQAGRASSEASGQGERQSLFDSFAAEGLISPDRNVTLPFHPLVKQEKKTSTAEKTEKAGGEKESKKETPVPMEAEDEMHLEIPMGRDSLVFVRDYYPWQVRLHPVSRQDMPRPDFAQVWSMADSSSIVWSDHKDFGGVAEFLLKDRDSIQKFMRKVLWHNYKSDCITVEITERDKSHSTRALGQDDGQTLLDTVVNHAIFRFHNTRGRQLIKTYYPTAKGEVTERSVYVNNVGTGVSADLMKAIFPCALKITVAKAGKGASSALVETECEEAAVNYLVVYQQIRINGLDLVLSTVKYDWEGAREKFLQSLSKKNTATTTKRPSTSTTTSSPAKKDRPATGSTSSGGRGANQHSRGAVAQRGRGATSGVPSRGGMPPRGGLSRGRGAPAPGGRGRGLLPDPVLGPPGEGLLPLPEQARPPPLLVLPAKPSRHGMIEADYMMSQDVERRTAELQEMHQELESQVLHTRAKLAHAARLAEVEAAEADLEGHLAQLDYAHRTGFSTRPRRPPPPEFAEEEEERVREPPRRTLLSLDGQPRLERDELLNEPPPYRRPLPPPPRPERDYMPPAGARGRRQEDFGDQRPSGRPRPYLLEAPPGPERGPPGEEDPYAPVYDYEHPPKRSRMEPDLSPEERQALLRRLVSGERGRPAYPEERAARREELYDYEDCEARRPPSYPGSRREYEEDMGRAAGPSRYREDYDRHYL